MIGERIKHYDIISRLGAGGMGEVFLATDTKLGRQVALKFLPREIASDPERRQRLQLEAKTASSLDHPNILTIYEIDEHDGRPFIAMAYVEGATLKEKMEHGPLLLTSAVRYGIQIASGLGAAHARGIVHRDVKPDNVLIGQDDRARLTDFGLAKLRESSGLTGEGTTVGTVGYMSPEQAQGQTVDARSDVFSLGIMLYEMLVGQRPFIAQHAAAALYSIVHETPRPLREINPEIPEPLAAVVNRALAKSPSERYPDAVALEQDLRTVARNLEFSSISSGTIPVTRTRSKGRLAWVSAGILVMLAGVFLVLSSGLFKAGPEPVTAGENTLAVMYFENLSDPDDEERLGDIITELLTTDLSGSEFVTVVSSQRLHDLLRQEGITSSRIDRSVASRIARKAGATRMLTGTLSRLAGRTVVTAQLINVGSGEVVGSERVDGNDLFRVVDDLSVGIKEKLGLSESEARAGDISVADVTTASAEAYREYLSGLDYYHSLDWVDAQRHFDHAIALDSGFALAYLRKGVAYFSDGQRAQGLASLAAAYRHVDRATGCDRLLIEAFGRDLGENWNIEAALRTLKRATIQCPTHKEPFFWVANLLSGFKTEADSVIVYAQKALDLDPDYPFALLVIYNAYNDRKDFGRALAVIDRYRKTRPNDVFPYVAQGELYINQGNLDSAAIMARGAIRVAPDQRQGYFALAQVHVLKGQPDSAIATYQRLFHIDENPFTEVAAFRQIGAVHRAWGRFDAAVDAYNRAYRVADEAGLVDQAAHTERLHGWMLVSTDRLNEAIKRFLHSEEMDTLGHAGLISVAQAYAENGQNQEARRAFREIQSKLTGRIDDRVIQSIEYSVEAAIAFRSGDAESTIRLIKQSREASGDTTDMSVKYARALVQIGRYKEAIDHLTATRREAETSWPSDTYIRSLYYLADALVKAGRRQDALEPLQRFLVFWGQADWDIPIARDAKQLYGSLAAQ